MNKVLVQFGNLLRVRLEKGVFTSEDSMRYTFFAALLQAGGLEPEDIVLEYPHPVIRRAEIDTWIPSFKGETMAVEFKYDRDIPSGRNTPTTQKAGKLFHDLHRLLLVAEKDKTRCLFVYLATKEMSNYLGNRANGLDDFYSLFPGATPEIKKRYFSGKSATFQREMGSEFEAAVTSLFSQSLPREHNLRIHEVAQSAPAV